MGGGSGKCPWKRSSKGRVRIRRLYRHRLPGVRSQDLPPGLVISDWFHSVFKKVMSAALSSGLNSLKCLAGSRASPSCREIAFSRDRDPKSCMKRAFVRNPQRGAVLSLLAVSCGPTWTIPSPVPMSCNKKSLKGWMILSPRASGTVNIPPSITVP